MQYDMNAETEQVARALAADEISFQDPRAITAGEVQEYATSDAAPASVQGILKRIRTARINWDQVAQYLRVN